MRSKTTICACLFLLTVSFSCKQPPKTESNPQEQSVEHLVLAKPIPSTELMHKIPELAFYNRKMQEALKKPIPVLLLAENEIQDTNQLIAQEIALLDPNFTRDVLEPGSGEPLRNEIMNIREALPSDLPPGIPCQKGDCYRVSMYHYFDNRSTVAIVNVRERKVVFVDRPRGGQPEISKRLTDLAVQIAIHSPEVIEALGINPNEREATMANVKTALNGTQCERSRHLCVAPTFLNKTNERALWAIVDLTDWKLVGLKWTNLGESGKPTRATERSLQNDYVMENFCEVNNQLRQNDWNIYYRLTSSDGLEIFDVEYKHKKIIRSAKVVDWHVGYSTKEGFGYSDAMGCPMYSSSAVVAFNGPYTEPILERQDTVGFALIQDFRSPAWPVPCNYRYHNRFEFYRDGKFRIVTENLGRGCGVDGVYRPISRIDLFGENNQERFQQWNGSKWVDWDKEQWSLQQKDSRYTPEGYLYRIIHPSGGGFYIEPGNGQFSDSGRGDNAYTYVSLRHPDREGDVDLMTIGSCCNTDHNQGPENFLEPAENIQNSDIVIWYVSQMYNDDRPGKEYCWANTVVENGKSVVKYWPGSAGPLFIPFSD
jgi:hypothetical protein